jgi:hypothetical protein
VGFRLTLLLLKIADTTKQRAMKHPQSKKKPNQMLGSVTVEKPVA